ncbi:hypothetical protein GQ231_002422 [Salmonella enterica]|nr:hypothetical protein [Salmonella enterica]
MGRLKSERYIQRGRNTTAMLGVVHSNQDMIFVQKVLFIGFVSTLIDSQDRPIS